MRKNVLLLIFIVALSSCISNINIEEISEDDFWKMKKNYHLFVDTVIPPNITITDTLAYGEKYTNIKVNINSAKQLVKYFKFIESDDTIRAYTYYGSINEHYLIHVTEMHDCYFLLVNMDDGDLIQLPGEDIMFFKDGSLFASQTYAGDGDRIPIDRWGLFEYVNGRYINTINVQSKKWIIGGFHYLSATRVAFFLDSYEKHNRIYYIADIDYLENIVNP